MYLLVSVLLCDVVWGVLLGFVVLAGKMVVLRCVTVLLCRLVVVLGLVVLDSLPSRPVVVIPCAFCCCCSHQIL